MENIEKLKKILEQLSAEEKQQLKELLKVRREREKKIIPPEAQELIDRYWQLKDELSEVRKELMEKYGLTPSGTPPRRGYGNYDYRGTPAYNVVVSILKEYGRISREKLDEELRKHGYTGITGTIGVVLKNLREDGLIEKSGGEYVWTGER